MSSTARASSTSTSRPNPVAMERSTWQPAPPRSRRPTSPTPTPRNSRSKAVRPRSPRLRRDAAARRAGQNQRRHGLGRDPVPPPPPPESRRTRCWAASTPAMVSRPGKAPIGRRAPLRSWYPGADHRCQRRARLAQVAFDGGTRRRLSNGADARTVLPRRDDIRGSGDAPGDLRRARDRPVRFPRGGRDRAAAVIMGSPAANNALTSRRSWKGRRPTNPRSESLPPAPTLPLRRAARRGLTAPPRACAPRLRHEFERGRKLINPWVSRTLGDAARFTRSCGRNGEKIGTQSDRRIVGVRRGTPNGARRRLLTTMSSAVMRCWWNSCQPRPRPCG